jgi:5-methylcytosine-specific restriction endonuclease McrA
MSNRYIPDARSCFPTVKGITEKQLDNRKTRDRIKEEFFALSKAERDNQQKEAELRYSAKKAQERKKKEAIKAGKEAILKVKQLENQIARMKEGYKNSRPQYVKGMKSDFYNTQEWRELRWKVIQESKGCCYICGRNNKKDGVILHVDHIKPRSKFPELELVKSNLQILCEDCNLGKSASIQQF